MTQQQLLTARPIILHAWEVRGLIAGTVTQLWRAMKRQPKGVLDPWNGAIEPGEVWMCRGWPVRCVESRGRNKAAAGELTPVRLECPYGVPGDRLWGRESWADVHPLQAEGRYSQEGQAGIPGPPGVTYRTIYRADGEYPPIWHATGYPYRALKPGDDLALKHWPKGVEYGWESSTSMPRWASRITLEIEAVSALRVREISAPDALACGLCRLACRACDESGEWGKGEICEDCDGEGHISETANFRRQWNRDNPRHPWSSNPYVWRLVVRRIES